MATDGPRHSGRKWTLIAPLVFAAAIGVIVIAGFILNARDHVATPAPGPPVAPQIPTPAPAPVVLKPLGRAELIMAANAAASAYASSGTPPAASNLVGRDFRLRMPFGCRGPEATPRAEQAYYQYDAKSHVAKITASVADWLELPLVQTLPELPQIEAVEGFWVPRPWTESENCPVWSASSSSPTSTPTPPMTQTLGLANIFQKDDSRVMRRDGRPYEYTRRIAEDEAAAAGHSYRLGLAGRIVGYGDRQAARCWSDSPDQPPACVFAVQFSEVWFEDGMTGERLAEWRE